MPRLWAGIALLLPKIRNQRRFPLTRLDPFLTLANPAKIGSSPLSAIPIPGYGLATATAQNGKIYAIGISTNAVEEYDPLTDTWALKASKFSPIRTGMTAVAANNGKLYAFGGYSNGFSNGFAEFTPPLLTFDAFLHNTISKSGLSFSGNTQILGSQISGDITLNMGAIQENNIHGNIAIQGGQVLTNTLTAGGISVDNHWIYPRGDRGFVGSQVQGNSIEDSPSWGIQVTGATNIKKNRLVDNTSGIKVTCGYIYDQDPCGGKMQNNLIANSHGVGLLLDGSATVISNTFTGNASSAIHISDLTNHGDLSDLRIQGNNFEFNTGAYDIENHIPASILANISAPGNWWGTTNSSLIAGRIYDATDDYTIGAVQYTPPATGPIQTAPAYVRSVTVDPNPVGIQAAAFDVYFSKPMHASPFPVLSLAATASWKTHASMPTSREGFGVAAADNGKIYVMGGYYAGAILATVEEYDPVANTWTTKANMLTPRQRFGTATSNGKIYVMGGTNAGGFLTTVEEYDPAANTWTAKANIPTPRGYFGATAASNGKIYAIGGYNILNTYLATVEEYDPATNAWAAKANMPTPRMDLGVVAADNGKIYAIGGYKNTSYLATVEEYDPATNTWTTRAKLPTPRAGLGAAAADNGKIYVIGGSNGYNILATIEEYDPTANTWTIKASLPTLRAYLGVATANHGKSIHAIGGSTLSSSILLTVEEFTPPVSSFVSLVLDTPQWITTNHFQGSYEITSLIPRGVYTITVESAIGSDGILIAPNSASTFTVDYASGISDSTPPSTPRVYACGANDPTQLLATWSASDQDSGIDRYQYAIGSTPGGSDIIHWTQTTTPSFTRANLGLIAGQVYYVAVKARNQGGLWSQAGVSNGVVAGAGGCHIYLPALTKGKPSLPSGANENHSTIPIAGPVGDQPRSPDIFFH